MIEIPFKQWRRKMAEELGVSLTCLNSKLYRGKIDHPPVRRVNKRVVYVLQLIP